MSTTIAFIDRNVDDLHNDEPAPRQMARAVQGREGLDAAHGRPAEVSFRAGALDAMDEYAAELAEVGRMLRDGAFQLRSCETIRDKRDSDFVDAPRATRTKNRKIEDKQS
jgi:hypothetical protein